MPAVAAVGVSSSIYQGISANRAAKKAAKAAAKKHAANQKIAAELKQREERLVDRPLEAKINDLTSGGLSTAGKQAEDMVLGKFGEARRKVEDNRSYAGDGLTNSQLLSTELNQAEALGRIRLDDDNSKSQQLQGYMSLASRMPASAQVAVGANRDEAAFHERQQGNAQMAEAGAWQGVAKGMTSIANSMQSNMQAQVDNRRKSASAWDAFLGQRR